MKTAFLHLHNREFNDIPYYRSRSVHVVVVFLNFTYSQTLCVQTVKYFSRLHGLTDSPEPPLVAYTTGTFSYGLAQLQFWLYFLLWNSLSLFQRRENPLLLMHRTIIDFFIFLSLTSLLTYWSSYLVIVHAFCRLLIFFFKINF